MTLVAGLGNIGKEYENTRHNVGFMLIDFMLQDGGYSDVSSAKFQGELYKKGSLLLLKPSTYMNASGKSLKAVNDFYKPDHIIVVHDELDIAFGAIRFKNGGSSGGHNGIKSIDSLIGNNYDRVRIGIGRGDKGVINYVLSDFDSNQIKQLPDILLHAKNAIFALVSSKDIAAVSSKFTLKA